MKEIYTLGAASKPNAMHKSCHNYFQRRVLLLQMFPGIRAANLFGDCRSTDLRRRTLACERHPSSPHRSKCVVDAVFYLSLWKESFYNEISNFGFKLCSGNRKQAVKRASRLDF